MKVVRYWLPYIVFLCSTSAPAQLAMLPTPAGFETFTGVKVKDFMLGLRAEGGVNYSDNVRHDPSEIADSFRVLTLAGNAESAWERHHLSASLSIFAQDAEDQRNADLDNHTLSGGFASRFDLGEGRILRLGVQRASSIIGNDHVDQLNGLTNGITSSHALTLGWEWEKNTRFVSLTGLATDVRNDTEHLDLDSVLSESLDRKEGQITLQLGQRYGWGTAYVFGGAQGIRYAATGMQGPTRDSDGWRLGAGVQVARGRLRGSASVIGFGQAFDTSDIEDLDALVGTIELQAQMAASWALAFLAQRNFAETNVEGSAGIFTNIFFAGVMYTPQPKLYLKVGRSYSENQLAHTSLATTRQAWDFAAVRQLTPRLALSLSGSLADQRANDPELAAQTYAENSGNLTLVFTY